MDDCIQTLSDRLWKREKEKERKKKKERKRKKKERRRKNERRRNLFLYSVFWFLFCHHFVIMIIILSKSKKY